VVLPDLLDSGLYVLFCGTAVGVKSDADREYYADPTNRFWSTLHIVGLTPRLIAPGDYRSLLGHKMGLTDLAKARSGPDAYLETRDFDVERFWLKIRDNLPVNVAFNGKKAAKIALGLDHVTYGRHGTPRHGSTVWILPSTSGLGSRHWDDRPWRELACEYMRLKGLNP